MLYYLNSITFTHIHPIDAHRVCECACVLDKSWSNGSNATLQNYSPVISFNYHYSSTHSLVPTLFNSVEDQIDGGISIIRTENGCYFYESIMDSELYDEL